MFTKKSLFFLFLKRRQFLIYMNMMISTDNSLDGILEQVIMYDINFSYVY